MRLGGRPTRALPIPSSEGYRLAIEQRLHGAGLHDLRASAIPEPLGTMTVSCSATRPITRVRITPMDRTLGGIISAGLRSSRARVDIGLEIRRQPNGNMHFRGT